MIVKHEIKQLLGQKCARVKQKPFKGLQLKEFSDVFFEPQVQSLFYPEVNEWVVGCPNSYTGLYTRVCACMYYMSVPAGPPFLHQNLQSSVQ